MTQLTITKALKNVRQTIETEQGDLDLDQACTIYDLCQALNIRPTQVLDQTTIALIDPPALNTTHAENDLPY